MTRKQVGITLTEDTLERLENLCNKLGMTKSNAISLAINKLAIAEEVDEIEEENNKKGQKNA
ncbi:MAG: ribbon-helix-helix protein, CopG family [Lactococcus lactis]|nr:ribbon-helix-helix protein, CopG family [Lactococcus lactis]MDN6502880.1 ribbon-helix-helix protein, CopG family [Tetragenococcus koreensis]MDN6670634.1 ribbon-helix-helix protein, CopG family [Tetragenococcus koreensis]